MSSAHDAPRPDDAPRPAAERIRATVFVRGVVQGVGFRWWTRARALELGLTGWARNTRDGRVEVVAEGPRDDIAWLLHLLAEQPRPGGARATWIWSPHPCSAVPKGSGGSSSGERTAYRMTDRMRPMGGRLSTMLR